jgi:hypothetical protein
LQEFFFPLLSLVAMIPTPPPAESHSPACCR